MASDDIDDSVMVGGGGSSSSMSGASSSLVTVATCNLNQWALDFDGNMERILLSCQQASKRGAAYRLGPELEISGYGCEDHFLEQDTFTHCWESLATLLERGATDNLLCDFGMPVLYSGTRYNCRLLALNRKILLIRPKTALADNGNYRESRYFTAYQPPPASAGGFTNEKLILPTIFQEKFQQSTAPFGTQHIQFGDGITIGCESCEELWTPRATHIDLALAGVEIIGNGSGSHHELRKLNQRLELIVSATRKCGGVYLYANQRGCDGGRLYYDGGALIVCNGQLLAQATQFSLHDVEVITATVDLDDVRSYRASIPSFGIQAAAAMISESTNPNACVECLGYRLSGTAPTSSTTENRTTSMRWLAPTTPLESPRFHCPEEECCLGPACWLWDYLRRSGASGFFLPLSGGADSSSVCTIVGVMCQLVATEAQADPNGQVADDCRAICKQEPPWIPTSAQEVANYVLHTTYMGTENSSEATTSRAKRLSEVIGSYHLSIKIDLMVSAVVKVFSMTTGHTPRFTVHGGTKAEDLALQNIQARLRMVLAYLYAQLLPWVRGRTGFLLVLGSANVDEGLRGYLTKYDCSSADLNPIGAISKGDLKKMLVWAAKRYDWTILNEIAGAPPTAELRPIVGDDEDYNEEDKEHSQLDEEEMGMTYAELGLFGTLRKISRCGPVTMYVRW